MARKKKKSITSKLLVIGGALALLQVVFILYFQQSSVPRSMKEELDIKLNAIPNLSPEAREQRKVQLAIMDFKIKNGKLPKTLNDLRPEYFDKIPIDPATNKPIAYVIEGDRFRLGQTSPSKTAGKGTSEFTGVITINEDGTVTSTEEEKQLLIASLDAPIEEVAFVYDSSGRRDPFEPFDLSQKVSADCDHHPLACYDIGQLRLTAVLAGFDEPTATVENTAGKGFLVKKGTKIGQNGGEVVEILTDRLKILETTVDLTGEKTNKVIDMVLRSTSSPQEQGSRKRQ